MSNKIKAKKITELDELASYAGAWIPASVVDADGKYSTGKYSLEKLMEHVRNLQLERRIVCSFERSEFTFLNAEKMQLYRVSRKNVGKLELKIGNGAWRTVAIAGNGTMNVELPMGELVTFRVEKSSIDVKAYVSFFGRVIND